MFRPLFDFILIRPIKRMQSRVLEVVSYEKYHLGMIVAAGPGDYPKFTDEKRRGIRNYKAAFIETQVKPGDFIAYVDMDSVPNYYKHYREDNDDGTSVEYIIAQEKDVVFIGEREEIDPCGEVNNAETARLIAAHYLWHDNLKTSLEHCAKMFP